ncbi:MAG: hypothetical protein LBF12_00985 [Christensenellaceae bacterium]|jgi:transposase|nr:hypothetical protein [Christensenellaceae bacterium]
MSDKEILAKHHDLTQIQNQFHMMKSTVETPTVSVWTREHIATHMLIYIIGLLLICIIQKKIKDFTLKLESGKKKKKKETMWTMGMTSEKITTALETFKVEILKRDQFRFSKLEEGD